MGVRTAARPSRGFLVVAQEIFGSTHCYQIKSPSGFFYKHPAEGGRRSLSGSIHRRLLLRRAVNRSESPNEIAAVDANHIPGWK